MTIAAQIDSYIQEQPEPKRGDLRALHQLALQVLPEGQLWFLDGKNAAGKIVSNPNIGYGSFSIRYADGSSRAFYRLGLCANATGLSVYIMTFADKSHLAETYAHLLGKAKVTGYCIRFKALKDIDLSVLETALRDGAAQS